MQYMVNMKFELHVGTDL